MSNVTSPSSSSAPAPSSGGLRGWLPDPSTSSPNRKCTKCGFGWKLHVNYEPLKELTPPPGDYNETDRLPAPPVLVQMIEDVASNMGAHRNKENN